MGKVSAFRNLLYALSRIPGLSFLRGAASEVASAERTMRNVDSAKKAAGQMKNEMKKDEEKKEEEKPAEEKKEE